MSSRAETIMQFLATALAGVNGVTVYRSRNVPVEKANAPWVNLYWSQDRISGSTIGNTCTRELLVHTVIGARGAAPDSLADAARVAVHAAMMADRTCGGNARAMEEVAFTCRQASADDDAALLERVYEVKYESAVNSDAAS